jgi:hypothetical protein
MGFSRQTAVPYPLRPRESSRGGWCGRCSRSEAVSLSEVLTALSYALDLTGGLAPGHTVRTWHDRYADRPHARTVRRGMRGALTTRCYSRMWVVEQLGVCQRDF